MEIIGIIGEFDPFHRGHAHLIARARAAFPGSPVVCAMSGPFTQRGGAAVASKYARAEMALRCGADLIVELPVQWAAASAERFARGGVALLAAAGATRLAFGSEAGALSGLAQAAAALDSDGFSQVLQPYLKEGLSFASARQKALGALVGPACVVLETPNNLLGIEYLRAIRSLAPEMEPFTVPRVGAAHHSTAEQAGFRSATALRSLPGHNLEKLRRAKTYEDISAAVAGGIFEDVLASLELGDATGIRLDKLLAVFDALGLSLAAQGERIASPSPAPTAATAPPKREAAPPGSVAALTSFAQLFQEIAREQGITLPEGAS